MALWKNVVFFLVVVYLATCFLYKAEGFSSDLASVVDRSSVPREPEWDYSDGPHGPAYWGDLSPPWKKCSTGTRQSPMDVEESLIKRDGNVDVPAKIYYKAAPAFIYGDGKILEVQWPGGIYNLHDYDYVVEKLVFHAPSEHTYYGERFPLEIQFYHSHPDAGVAINSIIFEEGLPNEWLQQFIPSLPNATMLGQTITVGIVDSAGVTPEDVDWTRYYRYLGSLTIPPCTQMPSVVWSLLKSPLTASKGQLERISAALLNNPNVRPIQPSNGRSVFYPKGADGAY